MNERTTRWFNDGARALRRTLEVNGFTAELAELDRRFPNGAYACPCCLVAYGHSSLTDEPRTLTKEHVPPESTGGAALVLTCRLCNNASGRVWDRDISRHQGLHDAVIGQTDGPVPVVLTVDSVSIRGDIALTEDMTTFDWKPQVNNPNVASMAGNLVERAVESHAEFKFQIGHHSPIDGDAAAWSWIRTAYLAAFAVLGYRYTLMHVMNPIQKPLADPQCIPPPRLVIEIPGAPSGERRMALVCEPAYLRSLMVDFGHIRVFLPAWQFSQVVGGIEQGVARLHGGENPRLKLLPIP